MGDVKKDVIESVNYFEYVRNELKEKEKNGIEVSDDEYPWMRMPVFAL